MFVAKLAGGSGQRLWGTYYGGSGWDQSNGCAVDGRGHVFVVGITKSTSGIATSEAHQTSYGGGDGDAFVVKFCDGTWSGGVCNP